jgi:hypothetical protein
MSKDPDANGSGTKWKEAIFDNTSRQVAKYTGHVNTINCMLVIDDSKEAVCASNKQAYCCVHAHDRQHGHTLRVFIRGKSHARVSAVMQKHLQERPEKILAYV